MYKKITYEQVKSGMKLFKPVWDPQKYNLLLNKDTIINNIHIKRLRDLKIQEIYIYHEGTDDIEKPKVKRDKLPLTTGVEMLDQFPECYEKEIYLDTYQEFRAIFEYGREGKMPDVAEASKAVETMVDGVLKDAGILLQLALIKSHDNYTVNHCVNVAIFSILLGTYLKWSKNDLIQLGIGALLHDIGKARIPRSILKKPGILNEHEFAVVKLHPDFGLELVAKEPGISDLVRSIIVQHHERCDGKGYPRGLKGNEICEAAKIVAIADVYDALTTNRVYRDAMLPHEAIEIIMVNSTDGHLEIDFVKTFLHNIAIYPVGSVVELTNGLTGRVIDFPPQLPMRPNIKLEKKVAGMETFALSKHPTVFINRIYKN